MISVNKFVRYPARRLLIKYIEEGIFNTNIGNLFTIFGQVKRVKVIGKIVKRKNFFNDVSNKGVNYQLSDGTGKVRALLYSENDTLKEGDIVNCIGIIKKVDENKYISIEIIKKLKNPELHKRYHQ